MGGAGAAGSLASPLDRTNGIDGGSDPAGTGNVVGPVSAGGVGPAGTGNVVAVPRACSVGAGA